MHSRRSIPGRVNCRSCSIFMIAYSRSRVPANAESPTPKPKVVRAVLEGDRLRMVERAEIRFQQLDGLRGLAAFVVFLFHAIMMLPADSRASRYLNNPVLRPFWDGPSAVMLFFVLSGFVLTLPYTGMRTRKIDPVPFWIRRLTRLYPAYWVALTLALTLRFLVFQPHGLHGLSDWSH